MYVKNVEGFEGEKHRECEEICNALKKKKHNVSRATVYRTLPLLTESNLVHEMDFGKPYKFYDPNYSESPNHNHLICEDCEKIVSCTQSWNKRSSNS